MSKRAERKTPGKLRANYPKIQQQFRRIYRVLYHLYVLNKVASERSQVSLRSSISKLAFVNRLLVAFEMPRIFQRFDAERLNAHQKAVFTIDHNLLFTGTTVDVVSMSYANDISIFCAHEYSA